MKKYIISVIFLLESIFTYSQVPAWSFVNDTTSIVDYSFSSPEPPAKMDTLGFKLYSCSLDSAIGFQVLEIKHPPCDSTNAEFLSALEDANGDTLKAIAKVLFASTNSTILGSQVLASSNGLSGLEIHSKYNVPQNGLVVVSYERLYYRKDFLITFTITGFQTDQFLLEGHRNVFFDSIAF